MAKLLFDFENMSGKDRAIKDATRLFLKAGANVVSSNVAATTSRRAGVTFRDVSFTFADGQMVTLSVKQTGDVFEARINGKVVPLRAQDDHAQAIAELAGKLDTTRSAYQKALSRVKVPIPAGIKATRTTILQRKIERRDALKESVALAQKTLEELAA